MAVGNKNYPALIKSIVGTHNKYWEDQRITMEQYHDCYDINFWSKSKVGESDFLTIQVPDANSFVEGYVASLFSKAPAVRVGGDIKAGKGSDEVVEGVVNRFLLYSQEVITNAARLALIYPMSFLKLIPSNASNDEVLDSLSIVALKPWDVILDYSAQTWESQRWVGHISYIPVSKANEIWGSKEWKPVPSKDYFDVSKKGRNPYDIQNLPEEFLYIQVVEFYDMINGKLVFWTPNWKAGDVILSSDDIPVKDFDGSPLTSIVPLYLCTKPDAPLVGFSSIRKIYDQIKEKNLLRTHIAKSIRRDTRQIGYIEGTLDEESLAKLEAGLDNSFIPFKTNLKPDQLFAQIPNIPLSNNYSLYLSLIEQDLARASVLAPFTRGAATNATATEVQALVQYTAAEIGKMARARDSSIEKLAKLYIATISCYIDSNNSKTVLLLDGKVATLTSADLEGKFRIFSLDGGSMPMAKAVQKSELLNLIPLLQASGVPKESILKQVVDLFDLDKGLNVAPKEEPKVISEQYQSTTGGPLLQSLKGEN